MKKAILTFLFSIFGVCFAIESSMVEFPQAQFKSVNSCQTVTGYQPNIMPIGEDISRPHGGPRKVSGRDDPYDPYMDPIGDIPWIVMLVLVDILVSL